MAGTVQSKLILLYDDEKIDKRETWYIDYNIPDCSDGATMNALEAHPTCAVVKFQKSSKR